MKLQNSVFLVFVLSLSFISCEKEESSIKTKQEVQEKEQQNNVESPASETLRIFTNDGTEYADIKTSATNQEILDHHLSKYSYVIEVSKDFTALKNGNNEELSIKDLPENEAEDLPEEMVCFEIIEASTDVKNISLSFEKNESALKAIAPTTYFRVYKRNPGTGIHFRYNPVSSDQNGIIFKWGLKPTGWFSSWNWDSNWRWIGGYVHYQITMHHPANNSNYYKRIGLALYTDNLENFTFLH